MTDRRSFLHLAGAGSAALWSLRAAAADSAPAATTGRADPSLAPLLAAGLDPFATYCRMFASTTNGAECAWWFMGALPMQVEDIGPLDYVQEETIRLFRVAAPGPGQLDIAWREVGVFRDIVSGEVPNGSWFNPVKGAAQPQNAVLKGGISHTRVRKTGDGVDVSIDARGTTAVRITLDGRIDGDRVCLTHIEEKTRAGANGAPSVMRTVFKLYSSLAELRGAEPSVAAAGFYGVRNVGTGQVFVNGLTRKARMDEKVNALAWDRIRSREPGYFDGDRLAPKWDDAG